MNPYSELKAAWHTDKIDSLRAGERPAPAQIQLVLSDLCNQNCYFCAYRSDVGLTSQFFGGNPNRKIPTEKALEILHDAAAIGAQAVQFTGGGEPTVHPDFDDIVHTAQRLGLRTGLVTNGTRIRPGDIYESMDWIRVSVDAGTEETYARTRESSLWSRVLKNLEYIGTLPGVTGVGFVVTPENYTEIERGAGIAAERGIDYIRYSAVFSTEGTKPYEGIYAEIKESIGRVGGIKVYDLFGDRIHDLEEESPDYEFCGYQYFNIYIGGNQKVYRCCTTAYTPRGELGSLENQGLREFFESGQLYEFDARGCKVCQFNNKNRVINYMIGHPVHVEFV